MSNDRSDSNRAEWEILGSYRIDVNKSISAESFEDGDVVLLISKLPLRIPKFSYRIGSWWNGHFNASIRPIDSAIDGPADLRAEQIGELVKYAEERCGSMRRQAEQAGERKGMQPRIGKTARDRAKPDSGKRTNNPALSQQMKGSGGGGGKKGR